MPSGPGAFLTFLFLRGFSASLDSTDVPLLQLLLQLLPGAVLSLSDPPHISVEHILTACLTPFALFLKCFDC